MPSVAKVSAAALIELVRSAALGAVTFVNSMTRAQKLTAPSVVCHDAAENELWSDPAQRCALARGVAQLERCGCPILYTLLVPKFLVFFSEKN